MQAEAVAARARQSRGELDAAESRAAATLRAAREAASLAEKGKDKAEREEARAAEAESRTAEALEQLRKVAAEVDSETALFGGWTRPRRVMVVFASVLCCTAVCVSCERERDRVWPFVVIRSVDATLLSVVLEEEWFHGTRAVAVTRLRFFLCPPGVCVCVCVERYWTRVLLPFCFRVMAGACMDGMGGDGLCVSRTFIVLGGGLWKRHHVRVLRADVALRFV